MENRNLFLDIRLKFIRAINEDIKHAKDEQGKRLPRAKIVEKMTELLGEEISIIMLYNWTAKSHGGHRFPVFFLPAFIKATGQRRTLHLLLNKSLPSSESLNMETEKLNKKIYRLVVKREKIENILKQRNNREIVYEKQKFISTDNI